MECKKSEKVEVLRFAFSEPLYRGSDAFFPRLKIGGRLPRTGQGSVTPWRCMIKIAPETREKKNFIPEKSQISRCHRLSSCFRDKRPSSLVSELHLTLQNMFIVQLWNFKISMIILFLFEKIHIFPLNSKENSRQRVWTLRKKLKSWNVTMQGISVPQKFALSFAFFLMVLTFFLFFSLLFFSGPIARSESAESVLSDFSRCRSFVGGAARLSYLPMMDDSDRAKGRNGDKQIFGMTNTFHSLIQLLAAPHLGNSTDYDRSDSCERFCVRRLQKSITMGLLNLLNGPLPLFRLRPMTNGNFSLDCFQANVSND